MADTRHKNANWNIGEAPTLEQAQLGLLMDIRDELQESNRIGRDQVGALNAVRHLFHDLGQARLKLLVREHHRTADLKAKRRRRAQARRRRELAAARASR